MKGEIMGRMYQNRTKKLFTVALLLASILFGVSFSQTAFSAESTSPCTIQNTLPAGMKTPTSEFGDMRSSAHKGTDFFYDGEQLLNVPQGCVLQKNPSGNLVWEQATKKGNGDPDGWGWHVVFDCGQQGPHTIKMRVAHAPKQPFGAGGAIRMGCSGNAGAPNNRTGEISHGCSRSGSHYHIETFIGDQAVDTQCIFGMEKTNQNSDGTSAACKRCPVVGSANLCDGGARQAMIEHGIECAKGKGVAPAASTASGVDPSSIKGGGPTPAPPGGSTTPTPSPTNPGDGDNGHDGDDGHGTPGGGTGWTPPDIFYPETGPAPEPEPPDPGTPGNPGGDPDLTPKPADGDAPEELSGCAADTWTAMVNQAVMETRREDILNKRFIVKADTVLDYSCFDMFVKKVADDAGPLFSETKKWANLEVDLIGEIVTVQRELGSKSLDGALMDIVQSVASNYRRRQFNHALLSGTAPVSASAGATSCDLMAQVWKAAKCKNFDGTNVFYTFEDLKTQEPREYPPNLSCN